MDKYFILPQLPFALALYLLGGVPFVVYGVFVRTVIMWHSTWLVNSATHLWGYRNYRTPDNSRNNWWVAILAWGEGWHNNHHAEQWAAKFGRRIWEIDVSWLIVRVLAAFRLARILRMPPPLVRGDRADWIPAPPPSEPA
jgi:stearoyl-CoA desaturase (delta-9 desaturase)